MVKRIAPVMAALLVVPQTGIASACDALLPEAATTQPMRPLAPEDLVQLRDIGPVDPAQQASGLFSVSQDGRHAAFQLRRADPATNDYCLAMVIVELRTGGRVVVADRGGTLIRVGFDFRGKSDFPTGLAKAITPRWSPDGTWIAYLRRDNGRVQLWHAYANGSGSEAITDSADDVEDFRITQDGGQLVFATRPGLRAARSAIDAEGLSGFHYDDRYAPAASDRPFPAPPIARAYFAVDLATRRVSAAAPEAPGLLGEPDIRAGDWVESVTPSGDRAWIEVPARTIDPTSGRLVANWRGQTHRCAAVECADASRAWWAKDGTVRFLRQEGWAKSITAVYAWGPGAPRARRLYHTEDLLLSCAPLGDDLACLREGSLQPRRLERLDPLKGSREVLFDPNPEFARLALGRVKRLAQTNRFGLESIADLVLPIGYRPGKRYPLVVVQYMTRGFLRGGTGDEYPIQAFAARGFAVLSVSRPKAVALRFTTDFAEGNRINLKDFADRRSVLDALEIAVRATIDRGIADPKRIGITGLSDGGATAGFALLHSNLFSAFAMSSCCTDTSLSMRVGPAAARGFKEQGYPQLSDDSAAARQFWSQVAFSPNAARIRAPILLQLSDDEYWSALQSYTALREVGAPTDLYVFPGEHHVKWQPAHRLAIYRRAIDWFDYWLNDRRDFGAERQREASLWDALRVTPAPRASATPTAASRP